jgi:hypothetical protein
MQRRKKMNVFVLLFIRRGYNSPLDISMTTDQLLHDLPGVVLTHFAEALQEVFPRKLM